MNKWIPVTERVPDENQWIDVWSLGERICDCEYRYDSYWQYGVFNDGEQVTDVTHWMPIPEPPYE